MKVTGSKTLKPYDSTEYYTLGRSNSDKGAPTLRFRTVAHAHESTPQVVSQTSRVTSPTHVAGTHANNGFYDSSHTKIASSAISVHYDETKLGLGKQTYSVEFPGGIMRQCESKSWNLRLDNGVPLKAHFQPYRSLIQ